jgi:hypothetical protein
LFKALNVPLQGGGAGAIVPTISVYTYMGKVLLPQVGAGVSGWTLLITLPLSPVIDMPPIGSHQPISFLEGALNIAVQDICGVGILLGQMLYLVKIRLG